MAEEKAPITQKEDTGTVKSFVEKMFASTTEIDVPPGGDNRFNVILQKMMNTRWYITMITMMTLMMILGGIVVAIMVGAHIA